MQLQDAMEVITKQPNLSLFEFFNREQRSVQMSQIMRDKLACHSVGLFPHLEIVLRNKTNKFRKS